MLAVVTGADGGIGRAFCMELARRGWELVIVSNRGEELSELAQDLSEVASECRHDTAPGAGDRGRIYPLVLDLTRRESTDLLLAFLDARDLRPKFLINNAGIFDFKRVEDIPEKRIDLYIELHIRSVTLMSRAFGERMAEQGGGRILNMSSLSAWTPMPGIALYSGTKAYIRSFTRALHCELKGKGVTATACCPGGIATDLFGLPPHLMRLAVRLGVVERPEKFARKAIRKAMKGRAQYINGIINRAAIPLVAVMPTWVRVQVLRLLKRN